MERLYCRACGVRLTGPTAKLLYERFRDTERQFRAAELAAKGPTKSHHDSATATHSEQAVPLLRAIN